VDDTAKQTARVLFDVARITDDLTQALVGVVEGIVPRKPSDPGRSAMYASLDRLVLEAGLARVFAGELVAEVAEGEK
jgi:hypothetical protein